MKSLVTKRSIIVGRHKTSVSLEAAFWQALREIADERRETLSQVVASIDKERPFANLSSALRLFVLEYYRDRHQRKEAVSVALGTAKSSSPS